MQTLNLRQHQGKRSYKDEDTANRKGVAPLIRRKGADIFRINAYRCAICAKWHVGNRGDELLTKVAPTVMKKGKRHVSL